MFAIQTRADLFISHAFHSAARELRASGRNFAEYCLLVTEQNECTLRDRRSLVDEFECTGRTDLAKQLREAKVRLEALEQLLILRLTAGRPLLTWFKDLSCREDSVVHHDLVEFPFGSESSEVDEENALRPIFADLFATEEEAFSKGQPNTLYETVVVIDWDGGEAHVRGRREYTQTMKASVPTMMETINEDPPRLWILHVRGGMLVRFSSYDERAVVARLLEWMEPPVKELAHDETRPSAS